MRIRFPPQLILFALGAAIAMAVPGLPRRHDQPPPIAAGLVFDESHIGVGWTERLEILYPPGTPAETLVHELRRQGFEVSQYHELLSGGLITYGGFHWPAGGDCFWMLGVDALSDHEGVVRDIRGETRLSCNYPL